MHGFWLMVFAIASGFTASGIVANLYRLMGVKSDTSYGQALRAAVMVIAGPSVIFESAMHGRATGSWSILSFWLVTGAILYWSLALGLFVLDVLLHI